MLAGRRGCWPGGGGAGQEEGQLAGRRGCRTAHPKPGSAEGDAYPETLEEAQRSRSRKEEGGRGQAGAWEEAAWVTGALGILLNVPR